MKEPEACDAAGGLSRRVGILQHHAAVSNVIVTYKYNVFSFVPICLYELLHPMKRFANFYFFCVGVMQMIPSISLTQGVPSTWATLTYATTAARTATPAVEANATGAHARPGPRGP